MDDVSARRDRPGTILLAEDNPVNQRVTTAMLGHLGFHVDVVADGVEAVNAAGAKAYHAILMDRQLPVLDGCQATVAIRTEEGSARHTPIIGVTASATELDRQRCLAAGMDEVLAKPLSLTALGAVLDRCASSDGTHAPIPFDAAGDLPATQTAPARVTPPDRPVLDAQVVARLERLGEAAGEDLVGQLTTMFLADADASLVALGEAIEGDDAAAVNRSAHALSGASANLGATDLARLCADLAKDGAAGDLEGSEALLGSIGSELGRVRSALVSRALAS